MYLTYSGTFSRIRQVYFNKIIDRLSLGPSARVLDYGCGPGDFIESARLRGVNASGIDSAPRSIELAKLRGITVQQGDTATLLSKDELYDAIVVQSVLEHVQDPVRLVSELERLLNPGGVLVLSSPTPGPFFWDDPTHARPHTPRSIGVLAEITGMNCEYISYVFAFLLGFELRAPIFFQLMNVVPVSLGTNLIAFFRKPS